jgi:hypothetical protein
VDFSSQQPQRSDINALFLRHWMKQAFQPHTLNWKRLQTACRKSKKIMGLLNNTGVETPQQLAFLQEKTAICTKAISKARRYRLKRLLSCCRSRA